MGNIVGIDIGTNRLKLVVSNGKKIKKVVSADMPENLVKEGEVVSLESMGEFLRETMKANRVSASDAAVVLHGERIYLKNVTLPIMTTPQLIYNLPFEFRDYITEELKDYMFDYAMESIHEEEGTMDMFAAAVPKEMVENYRMILRKAGLKMKKAAPMLCCYQGILRQHEKLKDAPGDYCILDLGYTHTRMDVFHGVSYRTTNEIEIGTKGIVTAVAEMMSVDEHIAHTYLMSNHKDCQNSDVCKNAYENMAVSLMRTMNFLRYSNPDASFEKIYLCGGGGSIDPLRAAIEESMDMEVHFAWDLFEDKGGLSPVEGAAFVLAAGILEDLKA
ncbi:MAG: pilus assembly protein PilM [Lachnospiraceae bacterium]|nr:pilus assembly protein PilM [Lachnospiraceae bacterium]